LALNEVLHIVCLDAPSPPDYGGAIDMYYKIVALAATGKKIILHYFDYGDRNIDGLKSYCEEIFAYQRSSFLRFPSSLPYIVRSRINKELIERLNKDRSPILLEGIHCSGILPYLEEQERVVVRMHNEEACYYKNLANSERNVFKRAYYELESSLLKKYYRKLPKDIKLACLSESDRSVFETNYGFERAEFIPCFIPWQNITSAEGKGKYCLYHGNLSVSENEAAAVWLIEHVFSKLPVDFVIAGKQASQSLRASVKEYKHISLVSDPSDEEMSRLISNAHIHLLPSMNTTGVKLKLLHALFEGRFCITNTNGVKGAGISAGVIVIDNHMDYIKTIKELFEKEFSADDKKNRQQLLSVYNNVANAKKISALW
jgi:hypothetical protein